MYRPLWAAVEAFWSERLPAGRPAWRALVISTTGGSTLVAFKLHHSAADGISALTLLEHVFGANRPERPPASRAQTVGPPRNQRFSDTVTLTLISAGQLLRGLASLAAQGTAPSNPLTRRPTSDGHQLVAWTCPAGGLRDRARALRVHPPELWLAVVGGCARGSPAARPGAARARPAHHGLGHVATPATGPGVRQLDRHGRPRSAAVGDARGRAGPRSSPPGSAASWPGVSRGPVRRPCGWRKPFRAACRGRSRAPSTVGASSGLPPPTCPDREDLVRSSGHRYGPYFPCCRWPPAPPSRSAPPTSGDQVCFTLHLDPALGLSTATVRAALQRAWDQTTQPDLEPVPARTGTG